MCRAVIRHENIAINIGLEKGTFFGPIYLYLYIYHLCAVLKRLYAFIFNSELAFELFTFQLQLFNQEETIKHSVFRGQINMDTCWKILMDTRTQYRYQSGLLDSVSMLNHFGQLAYTKHMPFEIGS